MHTLSVFLRVVFGSALIMALSAPLVCAQSSPGSWGGLSQPAFFEPLGNSSSLEGEVSAVLEDHNGFIWLVAANGLWRWDSKALVKARFITSGCDVPCFVRTKWDIAEYVNTKRQNEWF